MKFRWPTHYLVGHQVKERRRFPEPIIVGMQRRARDVITTLPGSSWAPALSGKLTRAVIQADKARDTR
jgi:hypothetical protein